jgi:hypothetical protein
MRWFVSRVTQRTIGPDKLNQLRHVGVFGDSAGIAAHMEQHRRLLEPKFAAVEAVDPNPISVFPVALLILIRAPSSQPVLLVYLTGRFAPAQHTLRPGDRHKRLMHMMFGAMCLTRHDLVHARPCNLKPQQRDLTPVLRRPVEPAP